jgi:phosphoribosyl 1,2-cyclic phosphodiesterase
MEYPYSLFFLGTGGGRFVTSTQKRRTAGIRIIGNEVNLHLDPGPGALVYSIQSGFDPQKLNAILVSHCHPDHYTDAEVMIEAMTHGTIRKRGILAAARSVLCGGKAGFDKVISSYHQRMPEKVIEAIPTTEFQISRLRINVTKAEHTDPDAVGFRFRTADHGDFAYTSDSEYFEGMSRFYERVRLLILCVMRPRGKPWKGHMTTDDAIMIVNEVRPELAVLTHLGMRMIFDGPAKQAKILEEKTGIDSIAASDGMHILFGKETTLVRNAVSEGELSQFIEKNS